MNKETRSGIYCIENKENHKKYIGQGMNVIVRMNSNHSDTPAIYNAIKKYGKDKFERKVVLYCEEIELEYYEIKCIKIFHSHKSEWGYNISWGGIAPMRGRKHSLETIEEMKRTRKGKPKSDDWKRQMSERMSSERNPNLGRIDTDETRLRKSVSHLGSKNINYGKPRSEKTRKLISIVLLTKYAKEEFPSIGRKRKNSPSQYYGVSKYSCENGKYIYWRISITVNKKRLRLGLYKTELEAALVYDRYVVENNLPHSINFPENYPNRIIK